MVIENLLELFKQLEFRTLGERVKMLVSQNDKKPETKEKTAKVKKVDSTPTTDDEKKLCLMLWIIDSNFTNPKLEDVYTFTKTDNTSDAWGVLNIELDKRRLRSVYEEIELPLLPVVEKMNAHGVKIDRKNLEDLSTTYHKELSRLEKEIWVHAGEEFNVNSPKQLGEILFTKMGLAEKRQKKTATGGFSTKESELQKIADKHPIIMNILDYRELQKLLSTYIDTIPKLLDAGSRLHSNFIQAGTTTGRMSSEEPNLQNIPVRTKLGQAIRHAFIAEDGFKLLSLDYSQIELRIAAILSKDEKLINIFKEGLDVHTGVAMKVFGVKAEEVDKAMRSKAKTINFGVLFGMGVNALRANLKTDRAEAQEFYNNYFSTFSGLAAYLDFVKADAERTGFTETMFGRRRYFAGLKSHLSFIKAAAERMAINAPIQGTEADIVKISMLEIDKYIVERGWQKDVFAELSVHDEIVYEVREDLVEEASREFKKIMASVIPKEKTLGVPILAESASGKSWGDMQKI